jgi:hypothetical protein
MAYPHDLPGVCLERTTTKSSAKRSHQHKKMAYPLLIQKTTRRVQKHGKAAMPAEVDRRTHSEARKIRKIRRRRPENAFSLEEVNYSIKSTTTATVKMEPATRFPFHVGEIVGITQSDGSERLALISDMASFHDAQMAVVCAWLYTRAEIIEDMASHGVLCEVAQQYLQSMWPMYKANRSQFDYMSSTERTIIILGSTGTFAKEVPSHIATRLCRDAVYHTDSSERRICDVNELSFSWLKTIL